MKQGEFSDAMQIIFDFLATNPNTVRITVQGEIGDMHGQIEYLGIRNEVTDTVAATYGGDYSPAEVLIELAAKLASPPTPAITDLSDGALQPFPASHSYNPDANHE